MKSTVLTRIAGAALLTVLAIPVQVRAQDGQERNRERLAHYKVIDLGTLGGPYSFGLGISNRGVVGGGAATATQNGNPNVSNPQPPETAFLWERGHMINLGTLGTPSDNLNSEAGPNVENEAALISETARLDPNGEDFCYFGTHRQCLAAIWKRGKLAALPNTLGGKNSQAYGVNDLGQVVGFAETADYDPTCSTAGKPYQRYRFKAVIWEPDGRVRELDPYPGDTVSFGFGINNDGRVVGGSGRCSNTDFPPNPMGVRSVLWERDRTPIDLGGLGGQFSLPSAINDRGDVDGASSTKNGSLHAYLWTKQWGKMHDLGTLHPDDPVVVAPCCNTVNNRRQVVGFALDANFNSHAFLWQRGMMVDLNTLVPKESPWNLQAAESINDAGQITGTGTINGETHAFLATPCHRHEDGRECCEDDER